MTTSEAESAPPLPGLGRWNLVRLRVLGSLGVGPPELAGVVPEDDSSGLRYRCRFAKLLPLVGKDFVVDAGASVAVTVGVTSVRVTMTAEVCFRFGAKAARLLDENGVMNGVNDLEPGGVNAGRLARSLPRPRNRFEDFPSSSSLLS